MVSASSPKPPKAGLPPILIAVIVVAIVAIAVVGVYLLMNNDGSTGGANNGATDSSGTGNRYDAKDGDFMLYTIYRPSENLTTTARFDISNVTADSYDVTFTSYNYSTTYHLAKTGDHGPADLFDLGYELFPYTGGDVVGIETLNTTLGDKMVYHYHGVASSGDQSLVHDYYTGNGTRVIYKDSVAVSGTAGPGDVIYVTTLSDTNIAMVLDGDKP